jgi:hypothetical protein
VIAFPSFAPIDTLTIFSAPVSAFSCGGFDWPPLRNCVLLKLVVNALVQATLVNVPPIAVAVRNG